MDLRNTWCKVSSEHFAEYTKLSGFNFELRFLGTQSERVGIDNKGYPVHYLNNVILADPLEFKSTKTTLSVQCKTDHERHMCEMLLRKMRGEGVQVKYNGQWDESLPDSMWLGGEYRATPEREFVVGEGYPCVDENGNPDVYKFEGEGRFTMIGGPFQHSKSNMQFIGESLGVIKFKP